MVISKKDMTDMTGNCKLTFLSSFYKAGMYLDFSRENVTV